MPLNFQIERDRTTTILRIPQVTQRDCGEIRCIASINKGASISASAQLRVRPSKLRDSYFKKFEFRSASVPRTKDVRKPNGISTPNLRSNKAEADSKRRSSSYSRVALKTRDSSIESMCEICPRAKKLLNGDFHYKPCGKSPRTSPIRSERLSRKTQIKEKEIAKVTKCQVEITIEPVRKVHLNLVPIERVQVPIDIDEIDKAVTERRPSILRSKANKSKESSKNLTSKLNTQIKESKERVLIKQISSINNSHLSGKNENKKTNDRKPKNRICKRRLVEDLENSKNQKDTSEFTQKDVPALVLSPPEDVVAMRGANIVLETRYQGHPEPTVKWMRAVSFS